MRNLDYTFIATGSKDICSLCSSYISINLVFKNELVVKEYLTFFPLSSEMHYNVYIELTLYPTLTQTIDWKKR